MAAVLVEVDIAFLLSTGCRDLPEVGLLLLWLLLLLHLVMLMLRPLLLVILERLLWLRLCVVHSYSFGLLSLSLMLLGLVYLLRIYVRCTLLYLLRYSNRVVHDCTRW